MPRPVHIRRAAVLAIVLSSTTALASPAHAFDWRCAWLRICTAPVEAPEPKPAPAPTPPPVAPPAPQPVPSGPLAANGTLEPSRGMIRSFYGDVNPFYKPDSATWSARDPLGRDLTAFWGALQPYRGMIRSFEGELEASRGMIRSFDGEIEANRGMIRSFWGDIGATRGMIRSFWDTLPTSYDQSHAGYATLAGQMGDFVRQSESFWGPAVQAGTGKSFAPGFADPLLKKYGIDLTKPGTLAALTPDRREMFFLEWRDGLMQFSGADQVDHWMSQVNWSPRLTQVQGSGTDAIIGLVDFYTAADADIAGKTIWSGGYTADNGHGSAVGGLIVASHDGKGIMGIAPNARVVAYNPFDATQSASWADLTKRGARGPAQGPRRPKGCERIGRQPVAGRRWLDAAPGMAQRLHGQRMSIRLSQGPRPLHHRRRQQRHDADRQRQHEGRAGQHLHRGGLRAPRQHHLRLLQPAGHRVRNHGGGVQERPAC